MRRFSRSCLLFGFMLAAPTLAGAQLDDAGFVKALVRAHHLEGLPYAEARELTTKDVELLSEMLLDPSEAEHRENVVMALGISNAPQAYAALVEYEARDTAGEVDAAEYRARRALPLAMGHLARSDPRALRFLLEATRRDGSASSPRWQYQYLRGEKLAGILRRAAITGLAMSGQPEAVAALHGLGEGVHYAPGTMDEFRTHLREAQRLCDRVAREGPDRVFGSEALQ